MKQSLAELQQHFAYSLRNPPTITVGAFNADARREQIYRELIFNNISSLLSGTFPVIYATLEKSLWNQLIRNFLIEHRAQTPLFPELPTEFLQFLQHSQLPVATPGWLRELAHYEWLELALQLKRTVDINSQRESNAPQLSPQLSPLAVCISYHYPVHRINPDYQPNESEIDSPTCLLVYREFESKANSFADNVSFMTLTPAAARLLMLLSEGLNTDQLTQKIADELQQSVENIQSFSQQFLLELATKGIIFGLNENTQS